MTFYVSSDLTSNALDLIRHKIVWRGSAVKAIRQHLGGTPEKELRTFATTWWPGPSHQSGIDLTKRALKVPHLIDEFFAIKKVVENAALDPVNEKLDQILQHQSATAPQQMLNYLSLIEGLNPGLRLSANLSTNRTQLTVDLKPGTERFDLGVLEFPASENGKKGLEKFQRHLDEGRDVDLLPGEAEWHSALRSPDGFFDQAGAQIKFTKKVSKKAIPVRLECLRDKKVVAEIPFASLRLDRQGARERLFVVSSSQLAGEIRFLLLSPPQRGGKFNVRFDPGSVPASHALRTVGFLLETGPTAQVKIISLDEGKMLFEFWGLDSEIDKELFARTGRFLAQISTINEEFGIDIRCPDKITANDSWLAEVLSTDILHGQIEFPTPGLSVELDATPDALKRMVEGWSTGNPVTLSTVNFVAPPLAGETLPTIEWIGRFGPLIPPGPIEGLADLAEHLTPGKLTHLVLEAERLTHVFPKWELRHKSEL